MRFGTKLQTKNLDVSSVCVEALRNTQEVFEAGGHPRRLCFYSSLLGFDRQQYMRPGQVRRAVAASKAATAPKSKQVNSPQYGKIVPALWVNIPKM